MLLFTPVRMNKLYVFVMKEQIGKVICAISDMEICHLIKRRDSDTETLAKKNLLLKIERRIDEILFKLPAGEPHSISFNIKTDADMMLYSIGKNVASGKKLSRNRLISIKQKLKCLKYVYSIIETLEETQYIYIVEAWIPDGKQEIVRASIEEASNVHGIVHISSPEFGETPPTLLSNPVMMMPFELLVKKYGLPSYYEIDPTGIIFISFPFIFGMMYGDVGHGIVLLLLSIGLFLSDKAGFKKLITFKEYAPILISCSLFSIIFGFLYGEYFGIKFSPIWLSPSENIAYFLILSIWAGVVHMILGLTLNAINLWKNNKQLRAVFQMYWILFSATSIFFYVRFMDLEYDWFITGVLVLLLLPLASMITDNK